MTRLHAEYIWDMMTEEFYDLMIICADGRVKSNKCFSVFYRKELSVCCEVFSSSSSYADPEVIHMPSYKCQEVFKLSCGFSKVFQDPLTNHSNPDLKAKMNPNSEILQDKSRTSAFSETSTVNVTKGEDKEFLCLSHYKTPRKKVVDDSSIVSDIPKLTSSRCCHICGSTFTNSQKMAHHMYDCHPKRDNLFECEICLGMGY